MEFLQSTDVYINLTPRLDGKVPPDPVACKYIMFNQDGGIMIEKTLGEGITFESGMYSIHLSDLDTSSLIGKYTHECVVRDVMGNDFFILKESVKIIKTTARL